MWSDCTLLKHGAVEKFHSSSDFYKAMLLKHSAVKKFDSIELSQDCKLEHLYVSVAYFFRSRVKLCMLFSA